MENTINKSDRIPVMEQYLERASALELARRSLLGAPVYTIISLIMLMGTPMLMDYGWWSALEVALLIMLGAIRVWFALKFPERYDKTGEKAIIQFSILTALQSLTLGVLSAMVIWQYWAKQEVMLTIVLSAGCIAAGTSALSVRRSAQIIFLACVLVPFTIAVFLVGGLAKAALIGGFLSLMAFLVQDGGQARSHYIQSLRDGYTQKIDRRRAAMENKARNDFMRDIGHEIRTPVNSIIGMTALLLDERISSTAREYAQKILSNSSELLKLVGNIPGTIKSDLQMREFESCSTDLRECIEGVADLYTAAASYKGIELVTEMEGLPEELETSDSVELEQVLANLLSNAVQYTEKGQISLNAFSHKDDDGNLQLEIAVTDTGPGIAEEALVSIFDAFDQEGVKKSGEGSGLGLPLCKNLVEQMGGQIWIESREGEGTVVRFTIRIEMEPSLEQEQKPVREDVATNYGNNVYTDLSDSHPHRILVVDDDDIHRQIMCVQLSKFGYHADEAADGDEAIAAVINSDYDLIFMDLRMPNMNGIESSLWIREKFDDNPASRGRIIALTGDATMEARKKAIGAGMDGFLTKPASPEKIRAVLEYASGSESATVV